MIKLRVLTSLVLIMVLTAFSVNVYAVRDIWGPYVTASYPAKNQIGVNNDTSYTIYFNEDIKKGSSFSKISLQDSLKKPVAIVSSIDGDCLTVKPKSDLSFNTSYTLLIPAKSLKDSVGNNFPKAYQVTFRTLSKAEAEPVVFSDKNLERIVRNVLHKETGKITKRDARSLGYLYLNYSDISNISALKDFTNLTMLNLSGNKIEDISPLKALSKLAGLDISENRVKDIHPIEGLLQLYSLNLADNNICDISALKALTKLETLDLKGNDIIDISPLAKLTSLTDLNISDNQITDIEPLKNMKALKNLYLQSNSIRDYSPVAGSYGSLEDKDFDLKREQAICDVGNRIISEIIKPEMTDFEKEKAIHDYLVANVKYDYENYVNNTIPLDSYQPYGVLINKTGVCQGYAMTFKLLLTWVDIECFYVSGSANNGNGDDWQNHGWNIVKLDGDYYHVDVTWDDIDVQDYFTYSYFNLTDDEMMSAGDHRWVKEAWPVCNGSKY